MDALERITPNSEVIVLTWFHQASRDVLKVHPRRDPKRDPFRCVCNTLPRHSLQFATLERLSDIDYDSFVKSIASKKRVNIIRQVFYICRKSMIFVRGCSSIVHIAVIKRNIIIYMNFH